MFMVDRSIGYIFSSETKEIDPAVDKGEFGLPSAVTDAPAVGTKRKRGAKGGKEDEKEGSVAISDAIMACATAMSKGMEKFSTNLVTMGEYMRPDPAIIEGENWRLMAQIESKIAMLGGKANMTAGDEDKLVRLRALLEKKEREAYGSV